MRRAVVMTLGVILALSVAGPIAFGQAAGPTMLVNDLGARTAASGLSQPISMASIGPNDMLVLEKASGKVKRVKDGVVMPDPVLDLPVNSASERGLLGIALHPNFPSNPGVYLYWTESSTGADSNALGAVPLLGNRVDRFEWDASTSKLDPAPSKNIAKLRAYQADAGQPLRGNHNGGVIRFGPRDGKLYVIIGDEGRRGQMQNLKDGPATANDPNEICAENGLPETCDDQYGGPEPDDAHLTGVILRLNDDGSAPTDNPFNTPQAVDRMTSLEAKENVKKVFAYGVRNGFGMAFDPLSGALWEQENGDDTFSELNRVDRGMNSGWVQIMGPASRVAQYGQIEVEGAPNSPSGPLTAANSLQQIRWRPTNIAATEAEAQKRLFMLPGAHFSDPELSWKYEVGPGGIGFVEGKALGPQYEGDLFMGGSTTRLRNGHLFRIELAGAKREKVGVDDPRLEDRVADNAYKWDATESEELLVGENFGIVTDVQTGPNGNLYVVSLSNGAIYEIHRKTTG